MHWEIGIKTHFQLNHSNRMQKVQSQSFFLFVEMNISLRNMPYIIWRIPAQHSSDIPRRNSDGKASGASEVQNFYRLRLETQTAVHLGNLGNSHQIIAWNCQTSPPIAKLLAPPGGEAELFHTTQLRANSWQLELGDQCQTRRPSCKAAKSATWIMKAGSFRCKSNHILITGRLRICPNGRKIFYNHNHLSYAQWLKSPHSAPGSNICMRRCGGGTSPKYFFYS